MPSTAKPKILTFIRHAPSVPAGHLYGQVDADIDKIPDDLVTALRAQMAPSSQIVASPARRCQKTCDSLLSASTHRLIEADLWEQSFGRWDGLAFADLPDIGNLQGEALVNFAAPNGESFADLCARVQPVIRRYCESHDADEVTFFVHAGVIRAALALALGSPIAALRCEVEPLSVTKLRYLGTDGFSVIGVNHRVPR